LTEKTIRHKIIQKNVPIEIKQPVTFRQLDDSISIILSFFCKRLQIIFLSCGEGRYIVSGLKQVTMIKLINNSLKNTCMVKKFGANSIKYSTS